MCLEFQTIIPKSVFHGILIEKVFQIEVSDGLVHSLGTCQKVNLHTARVFTGARFSGVCMCLEFQTIIPKSVYNSIFKG